MTTLRTAFFIAYKTLVHGNRSTLLLLVFILSLSFLNLMFITGILSGLTKSIEDSVVTTTTGHISLKPQEFPTRKNAIPSQDEVRASIETIPGVLATTRHYQIGASIGYDKEKDGKYKFITAIVIGIDPEEEVKVLDTLEYMTSGQFIDANDTEGIVLAAGLAGGTDLPLEDLGGAKVGDKVQVTYPNGIIKRYTVRGIYDIKFGAAALTALISAREAEAVLSTHNSATQILAKIDEQNYSIDSITERIRNMYPALKVQKYMELFETIKTFLQAFDIISYIVSAISVIVATVTLFVLIYVNAISRKRQIGILKAIGIKESVIVWSYIFQSLFYAVCGVILGSVLVFAVLDPFIDAYPIQLPFGAAYLSFATWKIVAGTTSLLVAAFFAGLIPAHLVARENIVKAIWG
jgi:putative ABC transport system permease protein